MNEEGRGPEALETGEAAPPGQKKGCWIPLWKTMQGGQAYKCPECGTRLTVEDGEMDFRFCPYCGTDCGEDEEGGA